jgi:PAS domain S-box-containing protein
LLILNKENNFEYNSRRGEGILKEAASRKQLERIVETIAEGIFIISADGIITYANEAVEEILGVKRSDLIGRPYSDSGYKVTTLGGKPYPVKEHSITQALRTGESVRNVEYVVIRPDGRRVIISENATSLRDEMGNIGGVVVSVADISTRKQAEEELKESERRFREMLEEIELIALILDTQANIIFANDFLLNLTGWQKEEVIGKNWFALFIPHERKGEIERVFHEVITRGAPARYENDIVTREGERHTITFNNVLFRNRQGNVVGVASIGHDITADKQAAEEIRESRQQVLDILESIMDGFFALDNLWRFTYVNQKAAQLIGRRKEELLFRNMWEVLPELEGTVFDKEYHRAKEEMVPTAFEALYPPLNKWFEVHVYPYKNGLSAYVSDITERKKAEEALKESKNRYRTLFEDAPIALWEQDASGVNAYIDKLKSQGVKDFRAYFEQHPEVVSKILATIKIIDVNRATLELYGADSKEEFIRNFGATVTKEGLAATEEFFISYAERGEVRFKAEFTSRTFKGEIIYVSVISFIPPGYEETRSKIFIATIDITERKKAEEALRSSQKLLQSIIDNTTAVIYVKDREGRHILINRQYEVLFHIKREEIVGKTDYDIFPMERADALRANDQRVLETGEPLEFEEVVPVEGEPHTYISIKIPLRDKEGHVFGVCGISTDITDRKKAEEALKKK